jgi:pimeloyl-ACP methyl ester carboxylesterase
MPGHGKNKWTGSREISLQNYVDCVAEVLDKQPEPVILAGHSMGGMVISQSAEYRHEKIKKLIYVCAFLLKDGESLHSKGGGHHNPLNAPYEVYKNILCGDCTDADARWARSLMLPPPGKLAGTQIHITDAQYGRIPRYYIECLQDNAIKPAVQKQMYTDMPCKRVFTLNASHFPLLSSPFELSQFLTEIERD